MPKGSLRRRSEYLTRKYGISILQYNELLERQGGTCALCRKTREKSGKALAVDHIHLPGGGGEIRGILCSYHNHRVVGRHKDPVLLRRVADYLEGHTGYFTPKIKKRKKRGKKA